MNDGAHDHDAAVQRVARWLAESRSAVAFTGAGISTESGIPDFRSPSGIWAQTKPVYFDEFVSSAEARNEYWRQKAAMWREFSGARPNTGHNILARWEASGRLRGVITQNIDELHQQAGSQHVLEVHGTARHVVCLECGTRYDTERITRQYERLGAAPTCDRCGGMLKHATVSFGQSLPQEVIEESTRWARESDLFFAIGSSLVVYPAASIPEIAARSGSRLVIINRDPTPLDDRASVVIRQSIGEVLERIDALLPDEPAPEAR